MLSFLEIRNFAIVEHLELELGSGMTVLTGETGAGKSILIDALGLVLGERLSGNPVRHGTERAEVVAVFDTSGLPEVNAWLGERELAQSEPECFLRRTVSAEGRSRAFVNNRPVPLQDIKALGELLVDIHGQHAHQSLLKRDAQRRVIDHVGGHHGLLENLAELTREWRTLRVELDSLGGSREERDAEMDLLGYQLRELEELAPQAGEYRKLGAEHTRLGHAERLLEALQQAIMALYDDDNHAVLSVLEATVSGLHEAGRLDEALTPLAMRLDTVAIELRDAIDELKAYQDGVPLDPQRLAELDQRIASIMQLSRKHHVEPDALPELRAQLDHRLEDLRRGDARVAELNTALESVLDRYHSASRALTRAREKAADTLGRAVTEHIQALGIPHGSFTASITPTDGNTPSPLGDDRVEFLIAANPGQPSQPLNRVASGGELSRVSLAIQVVNVTGTGVPTLIFDEVDVGIGGGVAEIVGQRLKTLGRHRQVLCITHLPQVASQGQQHLQVHKTTREDLTLTGIARLTGEPRVEEIARMLGGVEITAQTLAHAREMIERAG